jgi:hypothetical protein
MQQLSFQIGDVAQQFALGTNPMIIFAQQGGQVVQAISMMKGGATGFIGFLAGPWGAVILGAGMILGTLVSKSMESKKATNDLTSSLDVQKLSTYELIDAINKKADAEAKANKTSYEAEVANYNVARSLQVRTIRELEAAKAIALKAKNAALSPAEMLAGGGENLGAVGAAAYEKQVVELDAALKKANETVRGSLIPLVKREAVAAYDAAAAATLRYAKTEATLDANYHNHKITYDQYRQGLLQLSAQREKDQESVRGSANALIDAQARMEASTTHLSEAQAKLQLIKAQAARIKDPTSAQGVSTMRRRSPARRMRWTRPPFRAWRWPGPISRSRDRRTARRRARRRDHRRGAATRRRAMRRARASTRRRRPGACSRTWWPTARCRPARLSTSSAPKRDAQRPQRAARGRQDQPRRV